MGRVFLIIGVCFLMFSCQQQEEQLAAPTPYMAVGDSWADSVLQQMSVSEKLAQLIIVEAQSQESDSLVDLMEQHQFSGLLLEDVSLDTFLNTTSKIDSILSIPTFKATRQTVLFNNQFSDIVDLPSPATINAIHSDSLDHQLLELYVKQAKALRINLTLSPQIDNVDFLKDRLSANAFSEYRLKALERLARFNENRLLSIASGLNEFAYLGQDSILPPATHFAYQKDLVYGGLGGFAIQPDFFQADTLSELPAQYLDHYLDRMSQFQGLQLVELDTNTTLKTALKAGVDLFVVKDEPLKVLDALQEAVQYDLLSEAQLNTSVLKILKAKYWTDIEEEIKTEPIKESQDVQVLTASLETEPEEFTEEEGDVEEKIEEHFHSDKWEGVSKSMYEEAIVLASNTNDLLPFTYTHKRAFRLIHYGQKPLVKFKSTFGKYANFFSEMETVETNEAVPALKKHKSNRWTHIVTLDNILLEEEKDSQFVASVMNLAKKDKLVLINFGEEENLRFFDTTLTVIQIYDRDRTTESLAAQLLFGGIEARGKLPYTVNEFFREGTGISTPVIRLKYGLPEEVGISPEKLVSIDAIAKTAIDKRVTPGCQVLVAKNGNVIYSKAFGHHTYAKKQKVKQTDLYDVASITKVAATTLATMKLYDQEKITLKDRIRDHLECSKESTIKNIPVKKLLNHSSGLPPSMPIAPYLLYRTQDNAACDSFFCKNNSGPYTVPVADEFYLAENYIDTIWKKVDKTNYRGPRRYRYSDVNFMLVQRIVESHLEEGMDDFLNKEFYYPLGLRRNMYNPLDAYAKEAIIPTQNDYRWRHQQVHGYVHDEAAALFGGVGGNAGLFSTAEDLAVIFQMLLNNGHYGGKQYLDETTVKLFTNTYHGNHRGLGFDKPTSGSRSAYSRSASPETFGHTGFTGTCVWADPKHDLIFVFLSNRIYPNVNNRALFKEQVRERIHEVVYDALDTYKVSFPVLDFKPGQKS